MSDIENVCQEMLKHIADLLMPLRTTKEVRVDAFEGLDRTSRELAKLLKESDFIPRSAFKELYSAGRVLEAEAPYSKDPELIRSMAAKIQKTADLIIWGECYEDHKPGVPRME